VRRFCFFSLDRCRLFSRRRPPASSRPASQSRPPGFAFPPTPRSVLFRPGTSRHTPVYSVCLSSFELVDWSAIRVRRPHTIIIPIRPYPATYLTASPYRRSLLAACFALAPRIPRCLTNRPTTFGSVAASHPCLPPSPHPITTSDPRPDVRPRRSTRLGERFSRSTPIPGHKEPTAVISRYVHLSLSSLFVCHDASLPIPPVSSSRAGALSVSSLPLRRTGVPLEHTTAECLFPICPSSSKPRSHTRSSVPVADTKSVRRVASPQVPSPVWSGAAPPSQSPQTAARRLHHSTRLRPVLSAGHPSRRHAVTWLLFLPPLVRSGAPSSVEKKSPQNPAHQSTCGCRRDPTPASVPSHESMLGLSRPGPPPSAWDHLERQMNLSTLR
jgi:hypothetical protein